jgi:hypothetical protein
MTPTGFEQRRETGQKLKTSASALHDTVQPIELQELIAAWPALLEAMMRKS